MKNFILFLIAILAGWFIGSYVNMTFVELGHKVFPMENVDINDMQALAHAFSTMDYTHFVFPFLAHAFGTLVGAFVAALIVPLHKLNFALAIGVLFLIGGIMMCFIIPAPIWFIALDLIVAYIPMAYLGWKIASKIRKN